MMTATKNISIPNRAGLTDENLVELYRTMWEIRFFDEKVDQLFAKGLIHGTTHLAVGQEATAAGSGAVLRKTDWITATHRGHGQTINIHHSFKWSAHSVLIILNEEDYW